MAALLSSAEPWTRLGLAKGLIRLGRLEAADELFRLAVAGDSQLRENAHLELQSLALPMAAMTGAALPVLPIRYGAWTDLHVKGLHKWWTWRISERMLTDYLAWQAHKPERWIRVKHLHRRWARPVDAE